MRVISGSARGLKLISPPGNDTRPTLDRVKEALFSMLTPVLRDSRVLDLFAGSGALGIEALSRGAAEAVFVDNSKAAEAAVRTNIQKARMEEKATFISKNALDYLSECKREFSIIFMDPPYRGGLYEKSCGLIFRHSLLQKGGVIAVEWDEDAGKPVFPDQFVREKDKRYGRVHLTVLRRPI